MLPDTYYYLQNIAKVISNKYLEAFKNMESFPIQIHDVKFYASQKSMILAPSAISDISNKKLVIK